MPNKLVRKIVKIDEDKCNGCGSCALKCAEGALRIIDGKARLISENYCDGLGACLGECPQGAITIEERPADAFDEAAVEHHLHVDRHACPGSTVQEFADKNEKLACGCSGSAVQELSHQPSITLNPQPSTLNPDLNPKPSMLSHWPVQLTLVPPAAPFLKNANIVLTADCVPFAYPNFHEDFLKGHVLLIACPKLDDYDAHQAKLTQILRTARPLSLTVVHMEVPCCSGLVYLAKQAMKDSKLNLPFREATITVRGEIKEEAVK